jgi:NAD+ synthase
VSDSRHPREPDLAIDERETVRILEDFLKSEMARTGRNGLVAGLSGGIDSAVAVHLAARAVGADSVVGVLMPYRSSSADSVADAEKVVEALGIRAETVDISGVVDECVEALGDIGPRRMGNVMARARMIVLFDRSEEHRALVLGTSNKSELLLGYGTLHGDLAAAINPLGDLYKTQVRRLAEWLDVPESIRCKPPSADLWPDQSDEKELGFSYGEVDGLLSLLVDSRVSRETAIASGFDESLVDRVTRMIVRSQFKRRLPLIAKVSTRSVDRDSRYPPDWKS